MAKPQVDAIPKADLMTRFEALARVAQWGARDLLWETYKPYWLWGLFAAVGVGSLLAILVYTRVCRRADADPGHSLNTHGNLWVLAFLLPICLLFGGLTALVAVWRGTLDFGLLLITLFFLVMLVILLIEVERAEGSE